MLAEKLSRVRQTVAEALARRTTAKVTGDQVEIIAVTKNHPAAIIPEIEALGIRHIGENRVQEAGAKQQLLGHRGCWHLIGHLQSNKAKQAVELFDLIESADSLKILRALDKEARKAGKIQDVLLQLNIAGETQKSGFSEEEYRAVLPELPGFEGLRVRGIMVIAPHTEDRDLIRSVFRQGYECFVSLRENLDGVDILSMGMSGDYDLAVEEGANHIRVGSALFGPRDYSVSWREQLEAEVEKEI